MSLRSLISSAALASCILLAGIAALDAERQTNALVESPGSVVAQRGEERRKVVQTVFEQLVGVLRAEANRIAQAVRDGTDAADVFGLLAGENRRTGYTLEHVGTSGTIEAWAGPSVRAIGSSEQLPRQGAEVAFSKNGFWTYVTVASTDGSLFLSSPLASELPLNNKYFQRRNFVDDLSEMLGARPVVLVNDETPDPAVNGYERIPLAAERSERSIALLLPLSTRDSLQEEIEDQWRDRIRLLAAASVVLLLVMLWPIIGRVRHSWMRLGLRILIVWSARAALVATGVSSALRGEMLFDPTVYGSAFGWGLVATP
ncbi:MAG: hypothetical protein MUF82_03785, partial [Bacteroidetes bacterium]|nr:hypothetical protein [Bacteroidota bacterium]